MFGDVYQTLRWQYDNMIWLKQPSLQFTGLSEYSGKTLGWKWRSPGGYLPELRIYNIKERHKKIWAAMETPKVFKNTHTHALRLQCIQMMLESIESIARMDQSCGSVHQNPCFKTNGFAIESGPFSRLGLNFPLMVFFVTQRPIEVVDGIAFFEHFVFLRRWRMTPWTTGASCEVVCFFYMEDVQHDLSGWISP